MSLLDTPEIFTREMKRAAIEREITLRERVYPRRVGDKKMTQRQADREIAVMKAVLADYAP